MGVGWAGFASSNHMPDEASIPGAWPTLPLAAALRSGPLPQPPRPDTPHALTFSRRELARRGEDPYRTSVDFHQTRVDFHQTRVDFHQTS
eukprot:470486-Prorocentrum_minimum.AAC.1